LQVSGTSPWLLRMTFCLPPSGTAYLRWGCSTKLLHNMISRLTKTEPWYFNRGKWSDSVNM
jgi:hypothetical protein